MSAPLERRKVGRPKADEPKTSVSTWIPTHEYDRLLEIANNREKSVSDTVRQILRQRLRTP
jgi:hypothetical protein